MEEITFTINTDKLDINAINRSLVAKSKQVNEYYVYDIENSTLLRSSMFEKDFALMYEVVLLNHLFKSITEDSCFKNLVFSSMLSEYDPDKTVAELVFDFSSSHKEYEMVMISFEYLIERYGFKSKANYILPGQLMEVIDIKDLNNGVYEFVLS